MNLSYLFFELSTFALLGVLYYFYQKRKILKYDEQKAPLICGPLLQACLIERDLGSSPELDAAIIGLDDFLHNKFPQPPIALLKILSSSPRCPEDLKSIIDESVLELES
jgi:hypothetical protein